MLVLILCLYICGCGQCWQHSPDICCLHYKSWSEQCESVFNVDVYIGFVATDPLGAGARSGPIGLVDKEMFSKRPFLWPLMAVKSCYLLILPTRCSSKFSPSTMLSNFLCFPYSLYNLLRLSPLKAWRSGCLSLILCRLAGRCPMELRAAILCADWLDSRSLEDWHLE